MKRLILTPTDLERRTLAPILLPVLQRNGGELELCGFGPIAAAARTMQLLAEHKPREVILIGIAGGLDRELDIASATSFDQVACVGVGAGTGVDHRSADAIGWKHWEATGDVMPLASLGREANATRGKLLTVCAASANAAEAADRLKRHPDALAEDMEGFGVALACSMVDVPLQIVRGISNRAGDRDKRNWSIEGALHAAGQLVLQLY